MSNEIHKSNSNSIPGSKKKIDLSNLNQKALAAALTKFEPPRLFYQLVLFILDASESMTWEGLSGKSKGEEIKLQIPPIIDRLKKSKNKNCFDVGILAFSKQFATILPVTSVTNISTIDVDFNPCAHVVNSTTFLEESLLETEKIISDYHALHVDHSQSLIVLLTDGALNDYLASVKIIDRLKASGRTTISTCILEDKKWNDTVSQETLDEIRDQIRNLASVSASGEVFFSNTVDSEEIRKHMLKSISTVSKVD